MKSTLVIIIVGTACLITFLVTRRILQQQLKIGPPGLLAGLVAGLAFLGLTTTGEGIIAGLLIPYAAFALTLLALLLWVGFTRLARRHLNGGRSVNRLRTSTPCSRPADTRRLKPQQNPGRYERQ